MDAFAKGAGQRHPQQMALLREVADMDVDHTELPGREGAEPVTYFRLDLDREQRHVFDDI
ncbi:hypothetical protein GCM10009550_24500 [Actinocorallia libanotica]|uniref:Uncharacterized protein n=1 Tax=Actinocorallia libanotica TaxID=46162 RepID=A0ABN1QW08_9ACTN